MNRLIYFGTSGSAGHSAIVIKGQCDEKEKTHITMTVDSDRVHDIVIRDWLHEHLPVLLHVDNYSIFAIPLSRDDNRGGCITALITDFDTRLTADDFKTEIKKDKFLTKQFDI
jgi:hypothetical protein